MLERVRISARSHRWLRSYLPLSARKINILSCGHSSAFIFNRIFFILAGNKDMQQVWTEFEFRQDLTKGCGVTALDRCRTLYHWQDLWRYCKLSFLANLQQSYGPYWCQNWFLLNILRMEGQNLTKLCKHVHIIIDQIYFGIVKRHFFANLQQSYDPWLMSEIGFCSIFWEWRDRI